jgi:primosomal protein N' (replication factor Y)
MTTYSKYIDIAIALPVYNTFTYLVPKNFSNFISVGKRALVPFGKRRVTGYILGSCEKTTRSEIEIKSILDILDEKPLFPSSIVPFFQVDLRILYISNRRSYKKCPPERIKSL